MCNYKIVYKMIDGSEFIGMMQNRRETITEIANMLTSTDYTTHINPDGTAASIINNKNILHMEVSKV